MTLARFRQFLTVPPLARFLQRVRPAPPWEILLHTRVGGDVSMPALGVGGGVKLVVIKREKMCRMCAF